MICYASRTGTRSTLALLRDAGWRLLVSAAAVLRHEGFPYALDNGAWTYRHHDRGFDHRALLRALVKLGADADFVVLPDIVGQGDRSLELSVRSMRDVGCWTERMLIAVQDGVEPWQIDELLGPRLGVFVGGTTAWKLGTAGRWAAACRARGAWCHVGRVNTARRVLHCGSIGATSMDGTSPVKFPSTIDLLRRANARAEAQVGLPLDEPVQPHERPWWPG